MRSAALTIVSLALTVTGLAQTLPSFEVASVRPSAPPANGPQMPRMQTLPNGQFNANAPLRNLIEWAYGLQPYQRVDGSFRELDEWFVIAAKAAADSAPPRVAGEVGPFNRMLQSLLADRFVLRVRWENRPQTVSALRRINAGAIGRGVKILDVDCDATNRTSTDPLPRGCGTQVAITNGEMKGYVRTMADFARVLSTMGERAVIDDTGLTGPLELTLAFDPATFIARSGPPAPATAQLPAFTDALRDELGLRMESERRDVPVLIVEHVEAPKEN